MSDKDFTKGALSGVPVPTNGYAAKRPYCTKHSRAKPDIGGELKCLACMEEERKAELRRKILPWR